MAKIISGKFTIEDLTFPQMQLLEFALGRLSQGDIAGAGIETATHDNMYHQIRMALGYKN